MDRSWINTCRLSDEYEKGVEEFLEFAKKHCPKSNGKFICPCVNCKFYCPCVNSLNNDKLIVKDIHNHLCCDGFNKSYTRWIWHGERLHKGNKEFYLAPYLDSLQWQRLIICPRSNEVVFLCSLVERKLNATLKHKVNTAMEAYNKLVGSRKKATTWIFPNMRKHSFVLIAFLFTVAYRVLHLRMVGALVVVFFSITF